MQETQEMRFQSLGWEDPLEEGMATHSSILAWKISWTEELGRLQSIRKESDITERLSTHTHIVLIIYYSIVNYPKIYQLEASVSIIS